MSQPPALPQEPQGDNDTPCLTARKHKLPDALFHVTPTSAATRMTSNRLCQVLSTPSHRWTGSRPQSQQPPCPWPLPLVPNPDPLWDSAHLNPASGGRAGSGGSDREQAEMSPPARERPRAEGGPSRETRERRAVPGADAAHGAPHPSAQPRLAGSGIRAVSGAGPPAAGRDPLPGVWGSTFDLPGTSSETRVPALTSQGWKLRVVTPTSGSSRRQTG